MASEEKRIHSSRRHSTVVWHRLLRSLIYLLAFVFLLLVVIGNVSNKSVLRETYFLKLDTTNVIPQSIPNAVFINSIARSLGLHDFYQVGLWNYCEGYDDTGITHCSNPETLYWFDPVSILLNELLAGATIALPTEITDALKIARVASHWMFSLFITATVLSFIAIFLAPFATSNRPPQSISPDEHVNEAVHPHRRPTFILFRALPMAIFTFIIALFTIVASVVATVMFTIFANVFMNNTADLNIKAYLGKPMLAFMWTASGLTLLGFIIQVASCCCACCGGRKARKQLKAQASRRKEQSLSSGGSESDPSTRRRFRWGKRST
ncbi:conserved hypothetical protein [Talaromyces stipitatus ATCC 10500]|uniref:Integral membrane protein n=1 Tax=Talaromyces stipitatus (strain ATCC 10500 / CBS 375.48 / QM 6759 / NRRL 1006) TaxID=441959 RepID=B8LVG6_TALSN|nr:uncharacterized protein TSTA_073710 [Talaromyces stipitatus ATCC 10500]EED23985.1 conserved hypothetical protein [Talaromyces stipitatus ATCC 10500]